MSREDRLARILAEYQEAGGDPEQIVGEHPDLADDLRARFDAARLLPSTFASLKPRTPATIGDYSILGEIGRGGMGVVYEAHQKTMNRRVALKVLPVAINRSRQAVRRFQREAHAAGRIHHTNIVPVYEMGHEAGCWYYAMEFVEGRSLSQVITSMKEAAAGTADGEAAPAPFSTGTGDRAYYASVAEMFASVADGLEAAHQDSVVHRDIKPSNLLLSADGTLKIVDFGLAHIEMDGPSLTLSGDLLGTPVYMSPEQAMAKRVPIDFRTDIYSLGATLYEVLTLAPPFEGDTLPVLCSQIITKDPAPPRRANGSIPRDLETIVVKAMEKDRDKRYATAREMARDLRSFADGAAIKARPVGPVGRAWRRVRRRPVRSALVASVVVLLAAGAWLGVHANQQAARRNELEYASLCLRGQEAMLRHRWQFTGLQSDLEGSEMPAEVFAEAVELIPNRPTAHVWRGIARSSLDDLDVARECGLSTRTYHLARGYLQLCNGELEAAENELTTAQRHPTSGAVDAYFEGLLQHAWGQREAVERLLTKAIQTAPEGSALRYLAHYARGIARMERRDFTGAQYDLVATQAAGDASLQTRVLMAYLWKQLGNRELCREERRSLIAEARERGTESDWLALLYAHYGRHGWEANVAAEARRDFPDSAILVGWGAAIPGGPFTDEEKIDLGRRATELEPLGAIHWWKYALALYRANRRDEAFDACVRCLELDPAMPRALNIMAAVYDERGEHELAREKLEEAIALDPRSPRYSVNLAELHFRMGRERQAIEEMERGVTLDAEDSIITVGSLDVLARLLLTVEDPQLRDPARAVELTKRAIDILPKHPGFRRTLGMALYYAGDSQGAVDALRTSLEMSDTNKGHDTADDPVRRLGEVRYFLAMAHWQLGEPAGAHKWFDEANDWTEVHAPDDPELARFAGEAAALLAE